MKMMNKNDRTTLGGVVKSSVSYSIKW